MPDDGADGGKDDDDGEGDLADGADGDKGGDDEGQEEEHSKDGDEGEEEDLNEGKEEEEHGKDGDEGEEEEKGGDEVCAGNQVAESCVAIRAVLSRGSRGF